MSRLYSRVPSISLRCRVRFGETFKKKYIGTTFRDTQTHYKRRYHWIYEKKMVCLYEVVLQTADVQQNTVGFI